MSHLTTPLARTFLYFPRKNSLRHLIWTGFLFLHKHRLENLFFTSSLLKQTRQFCWSFGTNFTFVVYFKWWWKWAYWSDNSFKGYLGCSQDISLIMKFPIRNVWPISILNPLFYSLFWSLESNKSQALCPRSLSFKTELETKDNFWLNKVNLRKE